MSQASAQAETSFRAPGGSNYFAGSNWVLIVAVLAVALVAWKFFERKH
jgi:hypothetical protein